MSRRGIIASCALLALAATTATTTAASADTDARSAAKPKVEKLAKGLVGPLSMAVSRDGTVYVAQNFAGLLTRVPPGGKAEVMWAAPKKGTEVGAVSEHLGSLRFATTKGKKAFLWGVGDDGRPVKMADLATYEATRNPDAAVAYGFQGLDPACLAQLPAEVPGAYTGTVDSHPYATAMKGGTTYVADAGGNDVLVVSPKGKVRTLALLPPVPVLVTAEIAAATQLPACTVGATYRFEPVPTDVEVHGRHLYVSTLTGGPEDGSTGPQSKVYRVDRRSGAVSLVAEGLSSAVGVAVSPKGDVYVSQLFAGQVSRIRKGSSTPTPYLMAKMPAAVEWGPRGLYATTNALPPEKGRPNGTVVRVR